MNTVASDGAQVKNDGWVQNGFGRSNSNTEAPYTVARSSRKHSRLDVHDAFPPQLANILTSVHLG